MTATSRRGLWVAIFVAVGVAVPLLVLAVRIVHGNWLSFSDWALIEVRTRDVGTARTPVVGPYSRYGWNHPGPLMFYALTPAYRLLGAHAKDLLLGALAINTGSLAAIGVVCWRRGRTLGLVVGAAVVLVLARALHPAFLVDPWNPFVIVLPMLAVVMLSWSAVDGDHRWALPVAVALGSLAVQSHVGATLGVLVPLAIAAVYLVLDARAAKEWVALRTTAIIAALVGVVCWLPPIVQELVPSGQDRNLTELWNFWTSSPKHVTGFARGASIAGVQLSIPAPWFTGHEALNSFTGGVEPGWQVPFALLLLVGALVFAARRHDRQSTRLCVLALGLAFAAWVSASRVVDTPYDYVVQWIWIVGAVAWLAIIWTATRPLLDNGRARRATTVVLGAGVVVLLVALVVGSAREELLNPSNDQASLHAIAPEARTALRRLPGPVLIESATDLDSAAMANAILALAIDDGIDARMPRADEIAVGRPRTIEPARAASTVVVAAGAAADTYRTDPRYRLLASVEPLAPAERAENDALQQGFLAAESSGAAATRAWIDSHPDAPKRLRHFASRGPRIELYEQTS